MAQGAKAAATHTGALAGADAVYDAAFRRAGHAAGIRSSRAVRLPPRRSGASNRRPGKRLAILTNGGGIGVLAVDRLVELGGISADIPPARHAPDWAELPGHHDALRQSQCELLGAYAWQGEIWR